MVQKGSRTSQHCTSLFLRCKKRGALNEVIPDGYIHMRYRFLKKGYENSKGHFFPSPGINFRVIYAHKIYGQKTV